MALGLAALSLGLFWGCARPQSDPWPPRLQASLRNHARAVSDAERADYEAGFADGAAMVREALKAGRSPYRPTLDLPEAGPRFLGPRPEGVEVQVSSPRLEIDRATGLLVHPASQVKGPAFARGQVEGFTWALGAIGQALVRPVATPELPRHWVPWIDLPYSPDLDFEAQNVGVYWAPGLLAWTVAERGFPSRRTWRPWVDAKAPSWLGLTRGVLWIESPGGLAIALDLQSGGILLVQQAGPHAPRHRSDYETAQESIRREFHSPQFQKKLGFLRKAAESGRRTDLLAITTHLQGMGEEADREAFSWHLKAAELGAPEAMVEVGVQLFHGKTAPLDQVGAKAWLERAIRAGHPRAAEVMQVLFNNGHGRPVGP